MTQWLQLDLKGKGGEVIKGALIEAVIPEGATNARVTAEAMLVVSFEPKPEPQP